MFNINHMRIHLPAELLPRAERIARSISHEIAGIRIHQNLSVEKLSVPSIQVESHHGDDLIARRVVSAIESSLTKSGDE